ncbi:MAG: hypothetical protein R3A52_21755 [Polyangiales bacterium]
MEDLSEAALRFERSRVLWEEDDYGTVLLERVAAKAAAQTLRRSTPSRPLRAAVALPHAAPWHGYDDAGDLASLQRRCGFRPAPR